MKQTRDSVLLPPGPPGRARPPRGAHLDSSEDTGFSTELLRSQGFRPASASSFQGQRASGLGGLPLPLPPPWQDPRCCRHRARREGLPRVELKPGLEMAQLSPHVALTQDTSSCASDPADFAVWPSFKSSH